MQNKSHHGLDEVNLFIWLRLWSFKTWRTSQQPHEKPA